MVTMHSTPVRGIVTNSAMLVPAKIDATTDMNLMVTAISVYHRMNGARVAYDTLEKTMEAMRDGNALVTLYSDAKGELAARVLWPQSLTLTRDKNITAFCYCTLRQEFRSFRLDRCVACHALTTPDDCENGGMQA